MKITLLMAPIAVVAIWAQLNDIGSIGKLDARVAALEYEINRPETIEITQISMDKIVSKACLQLWWKHTEVGSIITNYECEKSGEYIVLRYVPEGLGEPSRYVGQIRYRDVEEAR
jgi:hypothetical protein